MNNHISFSIIVPVYNVDKYLLECLESIKASVNEECECIIVNDGSTDLSGTIAFDFCSSNHGFSYYEKPNGGLSDARNYGLKLAVGDYIVFIDSDDVVSSHLFSVLNMAINKHQIDVIYFDYVKFYSEDSGTLPIFNRDFDNSEVINISSRELAQKPNFAWARVARRELYENNHFPIGFIYEDVLTSPTLCSTAKKVVYIKEKLYGYRKRTNSITTSSAERQFKLFETVELLKDKVTKGQVPFEYYSTAFVNLIQSCLVSLVRIDDYNVRNEYRKLIIDECAKLSVSDVWASYSKHKFKVLTLLSKNKYTLALLSFALRPLVMFSDKKGR